LASVLAASAQSAHSFTAGPRDESKGCKWLLASNGLRSHRCPLVVCRWHCVVLRLMALNRFGRSLNPIGSIWPTPSRQFFPYLPSTHAILRASLPGRRRKVLPLGRLFGGASASALDNRIGQRLPPPLICVRPSVRRRRRRRWLAARCLRAPPGVSQ
jgi:hypothetical protein